MSNIYRLVDEKEKLDIQKNNRLSLSRPLLKYGEPEGLLLAFFRDINRLLIQAGNDISVIKPTEDLLNKIKQWHTFYYESFSSEIKSIYDDPYNLLSDLRILMCVYFQTYCGYFTHADLSCEETRKKYFTLNQKFISKTKKTAYVKIDIEANKLDNIHWEYTPTKGQTDFTFIPSSAEQKFKNNILASLHLHDVQYLDNDFSALHVFRKFNLEEKRNSSCWFKITKKYLEPQQEKRLIFYLPSHEINSERMACDNIFSNAEDASLEETLFYYAVSTMQYAKNNFPEYVYLRINNPEIIDI